MTGGSVSKTVTSLLLLAAALSCTISGGAGGPVPSWRKMVSKRQNSLSSWREKAREGQHQLSSRLMARELSRLQGRETPPGGEEHSCTFKSFGAYSLGQCTSYGACRIEDVDTYTETACNSLPSNKNRVNRLQAPCRVWSTRLEVHQGRCLRNGTCMAGQFQNRLSMDCLVRGGLGGPIDEEARGLAEQPDKLEIEPGGLEDEPQGQSSKVEPEGSARRARRAGQARAFVNNVCSFMGGLGNVLIRVNLFIDLSFLYLT